MIIKRDQTVSLRFYCAYAWRTVAEQIWNYYAVSTKAKSHEVVYTENKDFL